MAKYDRRFFEQVVYRHWSDVEYGPMDDDVKFEKLYRYILELEDRIEQLENNQ